MDLNFDEDSLKEIGENYETFVIMTDYLKTVEVYRGPLDEECFDMIHFYLDNGWLEDCTWTKREVKLKNGWSKLITEAITKEGEEALSIVVKIKGKKKAIEEAQKPLISKTSAFFMGLFAGLFSIEKLLEILGIGYLLNARTKKKEETKC